MRELRFVTRTEDGAILVEQPDGFERFRLPVDDRLRVAVAGALAVGSAPGPAPERAPEPAATHVATHAAPATEELGPREIQVRVRAGETPQHLADEHGMTLERVMRFAGPVMAERARITDEARRARARRTGYDDSEPRIVGFGEAVDERFGAYGIGVETVGWDAWRRDDGGWVVTARWGTEVDGQHESGARWLFDRASRSVTPLDDTAADLLSDRPIRPVVPPTATTAPHVTAPPLAPGVIAFPPFPDAHTGPIARVEEVFDQEDTRDLPRNLAPFVPADAGADLSFDEPPLPLAISDGEGRPAAAAPTPLAARRAQSAKAAEDDKTARARIPSWDDILLGVRRRED